MAQLFGLARLGRDAEVRYTQGGDAVAGLALAFSYGKKGADGNRPTQWLDASLWGQRAESLASFLTKGTALSVTVDDVHIETYDRNGGGQGFRLVGRVSSLEFAGGGQQQQTQQQTQRQAPPTRPAPQRPPAPQPSGGDFADMDDDIPF